MADSMTSERLIPTHVGGEFQARARGRRRGSAAEDSRFSQPEVQSQKRESRLEALNNAPELEDLLQAEATRRNLEVPEGTNLSLVFISEFQNHVRQAQDLRKVIQGEASSQDKITALGMYSIKRERIAEYLEYGPSFEKAYREYIKNRNEYVNFERNRRAIVGLENALNQPAFSSLGEDDRLDASARARIEQLVRATPEEAAVNHQENSQVLAAIDTIYPKGSKQYEELVKIWREKDANPMPKTKKDIEDELTKLRTEVADAWGNDMVVWFWRQREIERLSRDFANGEDVLETQTVVSQLNKLHDWEQTHQRTTIGGVLVGPPGVGKTTLVQHYLERTGRRSVYVDLSEDVTRYMLYGSKSLELSSSSDPQKQLKDKVAQMDSSEFKDFVDTNAQRLQESFGLNGDEATVALIAQVQEAIGSGEDEAQGKLDEVKQKVEGFIQESYHRELGSEFAHLIKRNGWRDGVVIAALRRGDSVILDEFNKNRNWSLIFGLMTAKPGEDWYFADNDERIKIPENWRMYFTANIGRRHGGFEVPEALASRAGGKVMEVGYPPFKEEMLVALISMADAEGNILRSQEDIAKMYVAVHELFPKIRVFSQDKRQAVPISYRTIRDLSEKLVMTKDPHSGKHVYAKTEKSFDEAMMEVLVDTYGLYEDQTMPKEIVNLATSLGLLLDDSVSPRVIDLLDGGKDEYERRKQSAQENKTEFQKIASDIRGISSFMADYSQMPANSKI